MCNLWPRVHLLCLLLAVSACSKSATSECGSNVCPTSKVCHEPLEICLAPEQLITCSALADGTSCEFPGSVNGQCVDGLCFDSVCGNATVDFGEVCDDGNTLGFDGCSADCRSDETCGNGIIDAPREQCDDGNTGDGDGCQSTCLVARCGDFVLDPSEACDDGNLEANDGCNQLCSSNEACGNGFADFEQGEQCDDGGFSNRDGCTSVCTAELPLWNENAFEQVPTRRGAKVAFRASTGRLTVFGGTGPIGEPIPGTLELRSGHWSEMVVGPEPPLRSSHLFVYDTARRVIVAFGGATPVVTLGGPKQPSEPHRGDTWELGEEGWREIVTATAPSPRAAVKGAWDPVREQIVAFGGRGDDDAVLGDTWVYDGSWTQIAVAGPPARSSHLMAYDVARDRTVLFGGRDSDENELVDTWEWDGTSWTEITTATTPIARGEMAYHGAAGIVAFSDILSSSNATWTYDGADWTEFIGAAPPARLGSTMTLDPTRDALVMSFGGPGNTFKDIWEFDETGWIEVEQSFAPPHREFALMAHDSLRSQTVFFGGALNGGAPIGFDDLWEWNGREWTEVDDIGTPPPGPRFDALLFDAARGCYLSFRPSAEVMEVHQLCGRVWTPLLTTNSPPPRTSAAFAYDSIRGRAILFGGEDNGVQLGDTWELVGDTWTELTTTMGPSPRRLAMTQFDPTLGVLVLFGGRGPMLQRDTWILDGDTWSPIPTADAPSPRFGSGMVFNASRDMIMIHGGDPGPINDSWEFDGTTWSAIVEPQKPEPRPFPAVVYDANRKRLILAGGRVPFDTWEFSYSSTNEDETCSGGDDDDGDGLIDCDDPDCDGRSCGPGARRCSDALCECASPVEEHCGDDFDDDCDGLVDCDDSDCASSADCAAESDCADGLDNDADGRIDCTDVGCSGTGLCEPFEASCGDTEDNDGDGRVDCQDTDCFLRPCTAVLQ